MKKMLSGMCVATVFSVAAVLSAQEGSREKAQMDKKGMMTDGQMTISGCVSAGKESGQYMLTDAMTTGGMMNKEMMDKNKQKDPGMAGGHMMSYELVGGSDLKAHMGHKVEVTGSMSKMDMDRMKKMQEKKKMDKGKMDKVDKMSDMDMTAMKLNVKSVKMVSATCP